MPSSSSASTAVVIDAGVGVARVLAMSFSPSVRTAWQRWRQDNVSLYAPSLWQYETASAIRKSWAAGLISADEADAGLSTLLNFEVRIIAADGELIRRAIRWAERLQQRVAYDGVYIALSERSGMDFWTTDQRLANGARQAGADWVHWIGELVSPAAASTTANQ